MNSAEIVEREIQRERCLAVIPLFAERIREPGETLHAHHEVLALNVALGRFSSGRLQMTGTRCQAALPLRTLQCFADDLVSLCV